MNSERFMFNLFLMNEKSENEIMK